MLPRHAQTTFESPASRKIDEMQEDVRQSRRRRQGVLIMGTPGSGKTTLMRQMKTMYAPYTDSEREAFKPFVYASLIWALRDFFSIVPDVVLTSQILEYRETILSANVLTQEVALVIHEWWSRDDDDAMPRGNLEKFTLHFLDRIIPIAAGDMPSDLDILYCTIESPPLEQLLIDVNFTPEVHSLACVCPRQGLRSAYKWLPMFTDIENVIFVLNLNDYDRPENMKMTYDLFNLICRSPFFRAAKIHIVINNHTSFPAKLAAFPLEDLYPDYTGGSDPRCAVHFLLRRFRKSSGDDYRNITHWVTDLMDVEAFRVTMLGMMTALRPTLAWGCNMP
ncbi:guanine nucleotide binding protein, alpha subunit [Mycena haematopus]|nr:guanine nucleotide binding protein, alpha subunit [Mycena haematopus]